MPPMPILLSPDAYRSMPWKNGQGTTTEIAVAFRPEEGPDGAFLWRVSIADVAHSGPFSAFAGYDRHIAVVDGAGMELSVGGARPVILRKGDGAFHFSGDAATDCALIDGPIRDFNLIVDRKGAEGRLQVCAAGQRAVVPPASVVLIHALDEAVTVRGDGFETRIPAGWTLRLEGAGASVEPAGGARAVIAAVQVRDAGAAPA